ncbi:MAG: hypothetical protein K2F72_07740, partial [Muribaculaceae bacterium]|nr:hypothetical protein [Muribaculaceae bacterium]
RDGTTVPEGYFDDFARRMADSLPERPELAAMNVVAAPRTMWERVRPYVYMAAMFAGVWCMLKMFTTVAGGNELAPIEKNPVMAEALSNDDFMNTYVVDDLSDRDIMDQMLEDGFDPSMFDPDPEQETE